MENSTSGKVITTEVKGNVLTINVLGQGAIVFDADKVSEANRQYAMMHGFKQRIIDAAALSKDENGKSASPEMKYNAMMELVVHYESGAGEWNIARAAGEKKAKTGKVLQAFANVYWEGDLKKAEERMSAWELKRGVTRKEALAIWRKADKIAEELVRMEGTSAAVDADDLLDELND